MANNAPIFFSITEKLGALEKTHLASICNLFDFFYLGFCSLSCPFEEQFKDRRT